MIKDNIIYFGYGDIVVGQDGWGSITLQQFKPPQEIGKSIDKKVSEYTSELIVLKVSLVDYRAICDLKKAKNKQHQIGKYTLDFNNYNEKSIDVVTHQIDLTNRYSNFALAC